MQLSQKIALLCLLVPLLFSACTEPTAPPSGGGGDGGGVITNDGGDTSQTVTVTFDSQGGSSVPSATVTAGSTVQEPNSPSKTDYAFTGWYTEAAANTQWAFSVDVVLSNMTLYAGWVTDDGGGGGDTEVTTYSVTYAHSGGTEYGTFPSDTNEYTNNQAFIPADCPTNLVNDNHYFNGWNVATDGSGVMYEPGKSVPISNDLTLYPTWVEKVYPITYVVGDFENITFTGENPTNYKVSTNLQTSPYDPVYPTGIMFEGYYVTPDFSDTGAYPFFESLRGVSNQYGTPCLESDAGLILYAKWSYQNDIVVYHLDGGENSIDNPTSLLPTETVLSNATKTNMNFIGWFDSNGVQVTTVTGAASEPYTKVHLYAKFGPTNEDYTITYNLDSGDNNPGNPSAYGTLSLPVDIHPAKKTGHKFIGWYDNAGFTGNAISNIANGTTGNITLYAKFENLYNYSLGDTGPAGGVICYINPNVERDGWKYLEVAPNTTMSP